jgi:hypothetical protein
MLVGFACLAEGADFYVATNGSDSNPGTLARPFLTLGKAQAAEEAAGAETHRNIYIRGGEYFNVTMLLRGAVAGKGRDDSGCSWIGYPGDPPAILYGGQPLTHWTAISNGWWQAQLPVFPSRSLNSAVSEMSNWEVRMLLVDGQMADRAQYPIDGSSLTYPNAWRQTKLTYINYKNDDIPLTMVATNAEVMIDWSWDSTTLGVSSIDPSSKTINFTGSVWKSRGLQYVSDIQTYRVYNTAEGMAHPGQFYFDRARRAVIYYPIGGNDPNTSRIIVPTTDRMWYLYGYMGNLPPWGTGPHDITFSNLTMKVCAVDRELEGNFGYLWNHMSLIHFSDGCGANDVTVRNCTLGWCGGNAIGGDFCFNTNTVLRDSEIAYCGGSGVVMRMGGPTLISNNVIHDTGLITWQCPAVRVCTNATIIQNSIYNCPESAIADHDVDDCRFVLNCISNCVQRNEDIGAYYQYFGSYTTLSHPHGNLIQSNLFCDVGTRRNANGEDRRNFFRPAIYLDEQSSNTVVDHNITLGCPTPVFCNKARSNAVLNNVFINTNSTYVGLRLYISASSAAPNRVSKNIFLTSSNFIVDNPKLWGGWSDNLFWSSRGLNSGVPDGAVIANPLLTVLAGSSFEFQDGSPARRLGIEPVSLVCLQRGVGAHAPQATPGLISSSP